MSTKLLYGTEEDLKEFDSEDGRILSDADREQILQQYDATLRGYKEGSIVKGVVVRVTNDDVFVDINFKSEGVIPREEFKDEEELKPGTQIDVYLEQVENQDGQIILSKQRADFMRVWTERVYGIPPERVVGSTTTGSVVVPLRYASTCAAAERPSAIAHTMSDCPRAMSPAANTPGTDVAREASAFTLPRSVSSTPSCVSSPRRSGPTKPIASSANWQGHSFSVPASSSISRLKLWSAFRFG